jgi:hypothetical protein
MAESYFPTTVELLQLQSRRRMLLGMFLIAGTLLAFGASGALYMIAPHMHGALIGLLGLATFVVVSVPVLIWIKPEAGIYFLFFAATTCTAVGGGALRITMPGSFIPLWMNISTIGAGFAHTNALNAIYFAPCEIIMILVGLSMIIKGIVSGTWQFRGGVLWKPFAIYLAFVCFGFVKGMTSGGDMTMALYEVRPQFWWAIGYFLAANLIRDRKQAMVLLWLAVIGPGLQSVSVFATYASMGFKSDENGISVHDDSLLFNMLMFVFFLGVMTKSNKRMTWFAAFFLPTALISQLANQRRAGIAAFIIAFVPLLPIMYSLFQEQRKRVTSFAIVFFALVAVYMPIAWNGTGAWALPARAIRSQSQPTERDASSDYYRLAEEANLKFTRNLDPWRGQGYGKPFGKLFVLATTNVGFLDYMPHHSVLWVWMRLGHFGFLAFFMLISSTIVLGLQVLRKVKDLQLRILGVLGVLYTLMIWVFGKYDLVFANGRQLFLCGTLVGVLGVLEQIDRNHRGESEVIAPEEEEEESPALPGIEQPEIVMPGVSLGDFGVKA